MGTVKAQAPIDPNGRSVLSQYAGVVENGRPWVLGQGTFGTVYKATKTGDASGQKYAIKVMTKAWSELSDPEKRLLKSEVSTLFKCKHQHIIGTPSHGTIRLLQCSNACMPYCCQWLRAGAAYCVLFILSLPL